MANAISTCVVCGAQFSYEYAGRGRPRRVCSEGCQAKRKEKQVPVRISAVQHHISCAVCGVQFQANSRRRYCSKECRDRRPRANRLRSRGPVTKWTYTCAFCGKDYHPRHKENHTTCSRECGWQWQAFRTKALNGSHRVSVTVLRKKCATCGSRFSSQGTYCSVECRPQREPQRITLSCCRGCGKGFDRREPGASMYRCSIACADKAKEETRRKARQSPSRKADKKRRKAMARGAKGAERVDVTRVFERDGYRCGICGRKTLASKRGTCHPRAPELDHIVAIALGGSHTYGNVQTACRSCNGTKGAAALGQLHLFPAQ